MGVLDLYGKMFQGVMYPEGVKKTSMSESAKAIILASLPGAVLLSLLFVFLAWSVSSMPADSIGQVLGVNAPHIGLEQINLFLYLYAFASLVLCPLFALLSWVVCSFVSWSIGKLFNGKKKYTDFAASYGIPFAGLVLLSTLSFVPVLGIFVGIGLWFWNLVVLFRLYMKVMKLKTEQAIFSVVLYTFLWIVLMIILLLLGLLLSLLSAV